VGHCNGFEFEGAATPLLELSLRFVDVTLRIRTNDAEVWTSLSQCFKPYVTTEDLTPTTVVTLLQGHANAAGEFTDFVRASKRSKDAIQEVEDGRLILKRRTGTIVGLWPGRAVAIGDLRANLKQATNIINACHARIFRERGYRLLHASGVSRGGRGVLLSGVSGAGKSTSALHLVEAGFQLLSNDRVLARPDAAGVDVRGYPKAPFVNPGTLLHHPRLVSLLEPETRQALSTLPTRELWQFKLDHKRAVDVDALYGPGTVCLQARAELLVLLTWRPDGTGFGVRQLDAESTLAHWPIYYKDLGFYDQGRTASGTPTAEDLAAYRELMGQWTVLELSGRPDFPALVDVVSDFLAA
jgi:HprK-related kinase B